MDNHADNHAPLLANTTPAPSDSSNTEERQFTLFKKLPIELRLRIWRLCFPRNRTVNIKMSADYDIMDEKFLGGYGCVDCDSSDELICPCCVQRSLERFEPMITLRINRESRLETLRCYTVFFPGFTIMPIYVNPSLDVVSFDSYYVPTIEDFFCLSVLTNVLSLRVKTNIDKIQYLKLTNIHWCPDTRDYLNETAPFFPLRYSQAIDPKVGGLRSFHKLKEIIIDAGCYKGEWDLALWTRNKEKVVVSAMRKYFEKEKARSPKCRIPLITIADSLVDDEVEEGSDVSRN